MGICGSGNCNSNVNGNAQETELQFNPLLQDIPDLPAGWVAYLDQRINRVYYQNNTFKTTQWFKPLKEVPAECTSQLPMGWTAQIDRRTGRVYYQNHRDLSTQWSKPEPVLTETDSHNFSKSEEKFICLFTKAKSQTEANVFENGECAVCFEELFENGPTVLTDGRKRVCRHFICNECAKNLIEEQDLHCPLCRAEFTAINLLPDIRKNPKEWYDVCDQDATGRLTRQELTDALTVILPIHQSRIEKDLDILWNKWDHDNTTKIKWDRATETVIPYVIRKMDLPQFQKGIIPDLRSVEEQSKWFDYWDLDSNGILDKQELARGLLKTFEQYMTKKRVRRLVQNLLEELWGVLVGEDKESISVKDFTKEDGFGATVRVVLEEAMSKQIQEEDDKSSVELVPALCPPSEQSDLSVRSTIRSWQASNLNFENEEKEKMGEDEEFYGYFTSPIATPERLTMEEKKWQPGRDSTLTYLV